MRLKDTISNYRHDNNKVINAFGVYHPYRGGNNPNFDSFSSDILKVKNMDDSIIQDVSQVMHKYFNERFTLAVVPSHDPSKTISGIKKIADLLCKNTQRGNAINCLVRHTNIGKSATGGPKSIQQHIGSIKLERPDLIAGKTIVLLDDVTTTNNSLLACKEILLKGGASQVVIYALAQTALTP